jgi:hypothetical protein
MDWGIVTIVRIATEIGFLTSIAPVGRNPRSGEIIFAIFSSYTPFTVARQRLIYEETLVYPPTMMELG